MAEDSEARAESKDLLPQEKKELDKPGKNEEEGKSEAGTDGEVDEDEEDEDDDEDDEDDDDEPKLKYARMTSHLGPVYRNGDATSTFLVAGDKMYIGTHNGNIHVVSLPSFQSVRVYHAHSASISSVSISPLPPPLPTAVPEAIARVAVQSQSGVRTPSIASEASVTPTRAARTPQPVPNIPSNQIYIASSSIDGKVCVASLVDTKDVHLRDFARPVQAVALSPDYKNDRTYLSGGMAGNLVLTTGARPGSSTTTTTGTYSATATGLLGSLGLSANNGKDTVLHYGEGPISTIKWSLSGKYVVWVNEMGIKILRSHLHLDPADTEGAWKRIAHIDRPEEGNWGEMATVWKARAEWIDESNLENDEERSDSAAESRLKQAFKTHNDMEKLLVGWGSKIWIVNVNPGGVGKGKEAGERTLGSADIVKILRMDCIVSGLSLYTPTLLLVLAYIPAEDEDDEEETQKGKEPASAMGHKSKGSTASSSSEPRGGITRRRNALSPELRILDLVSSQEVDTDGLSVSRYERLSSSDYHLGVLPAARTAQAAPTPRGALEALSGMGSGMWNATINATMNATALLSSAASIHSGGSGGDTASSKRVSTTGSVRPGHRRVQSAHPHMKPPGMKIFIHSPYDCVLATKRDLSDHLAWLLEHDENQKAWELVDNHPEVISSSVEKLAEIGPGTPERSQFDDFYDESTSAGDAAARVIDSAVEKEKRRIGELWIQQLIDQGSWVEAGKVCGKVLGTSSRWEHWVWTFAGAKKFDEITNFIPTQMKPRLPTTIYDVVLGHYIAHNRPRVKELLEVWSPDLLDVKSVITALETQLDFGDIREDSVEDGEVGRDWRIVMECLGKLYVADGRPRDALKCYIKLHDADNAMSLIKQYHLIDAISDDIPTFILLRVSKEQTRSASIEELQEASSEAISLLVEEAQHGLLSPEIVVEQLEDNGLSLYLFFFLKELWVGEGLEEHPGGNKERLVAESRALVDSVADLTMQLFASYDRALLMDFLKSSTYYTFEKATQECEERDYIPELVYLYSKTGQTKRALYLIIDKLADVSQAIAFAKEQDDQDLWEDLLDYSMDKPRFIRGLLEEVGTAINPITLVRRIPEGLEIEGLRDGLSRMIKEHEIQHSISFGVAKVLRGEVTAAQDTLRAGQRKAIRFDVVHKAVDHVDVEAADVPPTTTTATQPDLPEHTHEPPQPGHCVGCREPFTENESETLVGFACGHVFHLSHLLSYKNPERPVTPPAVELDENGEFVQTHSIGAKVTHARLLRDQIRDGCPVCTV
ncbi:vacuolar assembly protein-like protein [Xylogone sp. PMI_703]|nr:vacuolar assembly protein-like protein [Xylogone sp. PMI_703]